MTYCPDFDCEQKKRRVSELENHEKRLSGPERSSAHPTSPTRQPNIPRCQSITGCTRINEGQPASVGSKCCNFSANGSVRLYSFERSKVSAKPSLQTGVITYGAHEDGLYFGVLGLVDGQGFSHRRVVARDLQVVLGARGGDEIVDLLERVL